jgi:hypothetical protein
VSQDDVESRRRGYATQQTREIIRLKVGRQSVHSFWNACLVRPTLQGRQSIDAKVHDGDIGTCLRESYRYRASATTAIKYMGTNDLHRRVRAEL